MTLTLAILLAQSLAGTVHFEVGAVEVQSGGKRHAAPVGTELHEGDVLTTGVDARAEIALVTGSVLRIGPSARVGLSRAELLKAGQKNHFSARLFFGSLWARVAALAAGDSFEVEMQNAVAGVRGTEFVCDADTEGNGDVQVVHGTVEMRDSHGDSWHFSAGAGEGVNVKKNGGSDGVRHVGAAVDQHPMVKWSKDRDQHKNAVKDADYKAGNELNQARDDLDAIRDAQSQVQKMVDQARGDKDMVRLNCVNAKLTLIAASLKLAEGYERDLRDAVSQSDGKRVSQLAAKISLARQKASTMQNQADQCVGQLGGKDKDKGTDVHVETAKDLTTGDPTNTPASTTLTTRPPPASGTE